MRLFIRLCAAGLLSYAFPRLLIAAGVPLDAWILKMGTWLGASADWFNADLAIWVFTVILGVVLFGVETWWRPFQRFWQWAMPGAPQANDNTERVFIRARNTTGTKIIGSIFKGDRTHIDADGSTDLEAAANVHLASGTPQEGQRKQLIPLLDAFAWIAEISGWGEEGFSGAHSEAAALDLRQAALDGEIIIKGRKEINRAYPWERFSKVWEDIPSKYWATHQFDLTVILDETATGQEPETEVEEVNNMSASTMPHYTSLRVQTGQLEARWPKKGG